MRTRQVREGRTVPNVVARGAAIRGDRIRIGWSLAGCIGRTPAGCRVPDADDEKEAAP